MAGFKSGITATILGIGTGRRIRRPAPRGMRTPEQLIALSTAEEQINFEGNLPIASWGVGDAE
jgi:hypothetical protein